MTGKLWHRRPFRRVGGGLLLGGLAAAGIACSDHPAGVPPENLRPQVRVTGGPIQGGRVAYRTPLYWYGWDDDGVIAAYEVTVDPPAVFTREEIASPETAPGLMLRRIPALTSDEDTLRVEKVVEGVTYRFDYLRTTATHRSFLFTTPHQDSVLDGSRWKPANTASGVHAFYVRALDNEGAWSDVDRIAFTAWTYAPTSWITYPYIRGKDWLTASTRISISWGGFDPDRPQASGKPAGYRYKLIDLKSLDPPMSIYHPLDIDLVLRRTADRIPWTDQAADTPRVSLFVEPGEYVFAVRAVDVAGAVEPFSDLSRPDKPGNAFKFVALEHGALPSIVIREPTLGTFEYSGSPKTREAEVPAGARLRFSWAASAGHYGGRIEGYSWGVDIRDLDREGPNSGWSPWGPVVRNPSPITFLKEGVHTLYVRARDSSGSIQVATLLLRIFEISFERELLLVDDYLDRGRPLDHQHDAFWDGLVAGSGRFAAEEMERDRLWFDCGGAADRYYLNNEPPRLSHLVRHRTILWNIHGAGWCGDSGLFKTVVLQPALAAYMAVGGKVWITGSVSLAATLRGENCPQIGTPAGDLAYPLAFEPGDFAWDFLMIRSDRVDNDKNLDPRHSLRAVHPWDPGRPVLPGMRVDSTKFVPAAWERSFLSHVDAIIEPILQSPGAGFPGVLDSLYAYDAAGYLRGHRPSHFEGRLCAVRWHDPDPARDQGRVAWFGFPLYFFEDGPVQETFNRMIDWFREEETVPPAGGGSRTP